MEHTEHTVTVATSVDLVWEILLDVEGYAKIFPPTEDVQLLESSAEHQVARLTVRVNDEVQSWVPAGISIRAAGSSHTGKSKRCP